jgi:hypothetical protein
MAVHTIMVAPFVAAARVAVPRGAHVESGFSREFSSEDLGLVRPAWSRITEIEELRKQGRTFFDIGDELGVSEHSVRRAFRR